MIYLLIFHHSYKSCETRSVWGEETKCTFGFNAQGEYDEDERSVVYKGQFQFNDHAGTKFHIEEMTYLIDIVSLIYYFEGVDKEGWEVKVTVTDMGEPGADAGDGILIIHEEYGTWAGLLGGGKIQIH